MDSNRFSKKSKGGIHDHVVKAVINRLESSGRYDWIEHHMDYRVGPVCGEVDVLAYIAATNTYHFYEIKSNNSYHLCKKADKQFNRYHQSHPNDTIKGVLVIPDRRLGLEYLHAERLHPTRRTR